MKLRESLSLVVLVRLLGWCEYNLPHYDNFVGQRLLPLLRYRIDRMLDT